MLRFDSLVLVAFLMAGPAAAAAEPRPESAVQEQIATTVAAVVRQDPAASVELDRLAELGRNRRAALLLQLALYLEKASGTEQAMGGALLLGRLAFTPDEKLDAVEPHLTDAAPPLRRVLTEILATIDRPEGGAPDFRVYEERLRKQTEPPAGLVQYLYEVSPNAALDSMERLYGAGARASADIATLREILERQPAGASLSPDDRGRGRAALDAVAKDPAWWRRLYAAGVIRTHPALATPETSARLAGDADPLVRSAVTR